MSTSPLTGIRSTGLGSVTGVPGLPTGFQDRFEGRIYDVGGVKIHAVSGGSGPVVLLVGGWPQFWWQWRHVMGSLAQRHTVIAADPRGFGLSDKPETGYDSATMAADMHGLMRGLGHERFDLVGHDLGLMISYAMAADNPVPIRRLTLIDAALPGISPLPSILPQDSRAVALNWHFLFNRLESVNEALVAGREEIYFGDQFATKGATPDSLPTQAVDLYIEMLRRPGALHACFQPYRALVATMEQNRRRAQTPLTLPVLAVGGALARGELLATDAQRIARDVTSLIIPDCGHYVPEEAPDTLLTALLTHLS